MPTITVVRIKTFLSGVTGSVVDFSEALVHGDFKEDNILVTLLKKFKENASTICFGEDIWEKAFGPWFTKEVTLMDQNIRSLDANDNMVAENLFKELAEGSNFNFLIAHLIGMDHAGHSYDTRHPELQRKMHEVESTIEKVLQQIDDETTVVIFGDHGMTEDGSHGGSSDEEMRTVLFAYQKKPFPMGRKYRQFQDQFQVMDSKMKVADVAPIGAQLLNIPTPFSNIGNTHPIFTQSDDFDDSIRVLRSNIEQVKHYIETYCEETGLKWCGKELAEFDEAIAKIDGKKPEQDEAKVKKLEEMYLLLNHEYQTLITKWIDKDQPALIMGSVMALFTFIFHLSVSFDKSGYEQGLSGLAGLLLSLVIYLGTRLQLYELWEAAGIVLLISFFSSWTPRNQV